MHFYRNTIGSTIMSKHKIININLQLTNNPQLALPTNTLTEQQFCALVGMEYISPVTLAGLPYINQLRYYKLKAYNHVLLNRVVALRGIQYKSHNYCTSFTATADIAYATRRNRTSSINCGIRNGNLRSGTVTHQGRWSAIDETMRNHLYDAYERS